MTVITTTGDLKKFCDGLKGAEFITIDTEFMREKTYWAILCLVQVAGPDDAACIDPLADGIDLSPLFELLRNKKIMKVIHGGRQDIEIFYKLTQEIPEPLFDTQIAGMVCGFGDQVGYHTLVKKLVGETIDKGSRFTDWSHRPLTDKQIAYALSDVTHLREVYKKLRKRIEKFDRMHWLEEEVGILTGEDTYDVDPMESWKRIKIRNHKPRVLGVLREVAAWRERTAQKADVPRSRVLRDDSLAEIAIHPPKDIKQLDKKRGVRKGFADSPWGHELLDAVKRAMNLPEDELPHRKKKPRLPAGIDPVIELLRVLLKLKCEEHMVAPKLLASAADLELIAAFDDADVPAMKGWRREIFGEDALALKHGKLGLVIEKNKIRVKEI